MNDIIYLLSVLVALGLYAVAGAALWLAVEGIWWLFAKATGRDY